MKQILSVPPGAAFAIKVRNEVGGGIQLHVATIFPPAKAAFKAACLTRPTHEVALQRRAWTIEKL